MLRVVALSTFVLGVGCGGKAVDDPDYFENAGTSSSTSDNTTPISAADVNEELCITVCEQWTECGVGVTEADCLPGCLEGYDSAAQISCGEAYNALLECNFEEGVCDLQDVCGAESDRYTNCVQDNF